MNLLWTDFTCNLRNILIRQKCLSNSSFGDCQSQIHFKNYRLPHMIIKKASLITPTYFWLLDQIKMFCVFFNARVIGLYCHNWFFLPTSIIFHPILTRTTPIFGYEWHFSQKWPPQKGQMVKCFFKQIQVPFLFPSRLRSRTQLVEVHTTMYTKHKERTTLCSYQLLSTVFVDPVRMSQWSFW